MNARLLAVLLVGLTVLLCSCDPVTRHKVLSTIFDGVPSLPPPQEFCQDYEVQQQEAAAAATAQVQDEELLAAAAGSQHAPYAEKDCSSCHDKTKESGLVRPVDKLCFMCHPDIISGQKVHGPAAVGDCLSCHEPHSAAYPSLLKADRAEVCVLCHKEKREAADMHDRLAANGMICVDCHDPHSGKSTYFLK
jgi:predicted CXXCH cytochrome family protein